MENQEEDLSLWAWRVIRGRIILGVAMCFGGLALSVISILRGSISLLALAWIFYFFGYIGVKFAIPKGGI